MREKFVLCRPQGGINDSLTQIEHCWRYADAADRTLIVDTAARGGFGLPFGRLFEEVSPRRRAVLHPTHLFMKRIEALSITPSALTGRLNLYEPKYSSEEQTFVDNETKVRLSFDFRAEHESDILLHDQCGGGSISLDVFRRLRMTPDFQRDVAAHLQHLADKPYRSIVVRNSLDYQTDYQSFFAQIHDQMVGERVLVVSDDQAVLQYAAGFFGQSHVLMAPVILQQEIKRPYAQLMYELDEAARYALVVKAFVDLFGAALATRLYACKLKSGGVGGFSGFVLLAANLCKNKRVVHDLLYGAKYLA